MFSPRVKKPEWKWKLLAVCQWSPHLPARQVFGQATSSVNHGSSGMVFSDTRPSCVWLSDVFIEPKTVCWSRECSVNSVDWHEDIQYHSFKNIYFLCSSRLLENKNIQHVEYEREENTDLTDRSKESEPDSLFVWKCCCETLHPLNCSHQPLLHPLSRALIRTAPISHCCSVSGVWVQWVSMTALPYGTNFMVRWQQCDMWCVCGSRAVSQAVNHNTGRGDNCWFMDFMRKKRKCKSWGCFRHNNIACIPWEKQGRVQAGRERVLVSMVKWQPPGGPAEGVASQSMQVWQHKGWSGRWYSDCLHSDHDANAPAVAPRPERLARALRWVTVTSSQHCG